MKYTRLWRLNDIPMATQTIPPMATSNLRVDADDWLGRWGAGGGISEAQEGGQEEKHGRALLLAALARAAARRTFRLKYGIRKKDFLG